MSEFLHKRIFDTPYNSSNSSSNYTSYVANITQSGTSNPSVQVLFNNTGYTFSWTRFAQGTYLGTIGSSLSIRPYVIMAGTVGFLYARWDATNTFIISTYDDSVAPSDDLLEGQTIEIRFYL